MWGRLKNPHLIGCRRVFNVDLMFVCSGVNKVEHPPSSAVRHIWLRLFRPSCDVMTAVTEEVMGGAGSVGGELPSCCVHSHDFLSSSLTGRLVDTPRSSRRNLEGGF